MANKVRIGILGAGSMGRKHLEVYRSVKSAEVIGISRARPEKLDAIAKEFGIRAFVDPNELFRRVDAVDVCLPTFLHEEAVIAAAKAGLDVLCEKPIVLDPAAARRMIAACRKARVRFMVAHCLRFWPEYRYVRDALRDGQYGSLLSFDGWRYNVLPGWSSGDWLRDDSLSGGPTIDLHIHDVDFIRFLLGEPRRVTASVVNTRLVRAIHSEFVFPGGIRARAAAGWYFHKTHPFQMGYRAVFEQAVLLFHSQFDPKLVVFRSGKSPISPKLKSTDGYHEELSYFVDCVRKKIEPSASSAEDAMKSLQLVLKAQRATAEQL